MEFSAGSVACAGPQQQRLRIERLRLRIDLGEVRDALAGRQIEDHWDYSPQKDTARIDGRYTRFQTMGEPSYNAL